MTLDIGRNSRQEAIAERSRRRSFVQIVVGISADDSLALLDDDRTFFSDSSDKVLGGTTTSDDDQSDDAATGATLRDERSGAMPRRVLTKLRCHQRSHWLLAAQVNESTVLRSQL